MIMKRIDTENGQPSLPAPKPKSTLSEVTGNSLVPGLMYRGVPQDRRRLSFRIDPVGKIGNPAAGPSRVPTRRSHRELHVTQLYFG